MKCLEDKEPLSTAKGILQHLNVYTAPTLLGHVKELLSKTQKNA